MQVSHVRRLLERLVGSGSKTAAAERLGVSDQYLGDIIRGKRAPGRKVLQALGLERVVTYRRKVP